MVILRRPQSPLKLAENRLHTIKWRGTQAKRRSRSAQARYLSRQTPAKSGTTEAPAQSDPRRRQHRLQHTVSRLLKKQRVLQSSVQDGFFQSILEAQELMKCIAGERPSHGSPAARAKESRLVRGASRWKRNDPKSRLAIPNFFYQIWQSLNLLFSSVNFGKMMENAKLLKFH